MRSYLAPFYGQQADGTYQFGVALVQATDDVYAAIAARRFIAERFPLLEWETSEFFLTLALPATLYNFADAYTGGYLTYTYDEGRVFEL